MSQLKIGTEKAGSTSLMESEEMQLINRSCRCALLLIFTAAAAWLVAGSVLSLLSSIKFHGPSFLADQGWLTYGRIRPAFFNAVVYGFGVPAALAVALWMFARLGKAPLSHAWLSIIGAIVWNIGVAVGITGILAGDSTGYEYLEMPVYAAPLLFSGYLLLGLSAALTLHSRKEQPLYVSQWFLLAGLFWFPWIFSTAQLLISVFPSRGIVQSIIAWWYARNLLSVWLWLNVLAIMFYFLPKLLGRDLISRHLAVFTFWTLLLFAPWGGIPVTAPVPAWLPTLSSATTILTLVPLIAVALIVVRTTSGALRQLWHDPAGRFIAIGSFGLLLAGAMQLLLGMPKVGAALALTWFSYAYAQFSLFGCFVLAVFGVAFRIIPRVAGVEVQTAAKLTFWLVAGGVLLAAGPLALAGVTEALKLQDLNVPFIDVMQSTAMFLRISTIGELLLVAGSAAFFFFIGRILYSLVRVDLLTAYAAATKDLFHPRGAKT